MKRTAIAGNQQKVVLARELGGRASRPPVGGGSGRDGRPPFQIVAAEPTRGLDLAATAFVHDQLRAAAESGAEITLITSDLDEAFALANEIQVIYRGKLSPRMPADEATTRVANLMAGLE